MPETLEQLLARMRGAQQTAVDRQQAVSDAVNTTLAGGIGGLSNIAAALDNLKTPAVTSSGDAQYGQPQGQGALMQALASLAQAQLDATRRNAHVASAVNAAVIAGTDGAAQVAAGLRQLAQAPPAGPPAIPDDQRQANDYRERLMEILLRTSPGDDPPAAPAAPPVMHVCPTCQGSGRVIYQ